MSAIPSKNSIYWGTTTNRILAPTSLGPAGSRLISNGDGTTAWSDIDLSASYTPAQNTTNLQSAINAANAAGGGIVTLPPGDTIKLGAAGTSIYGASWKYCIRMKSNVTIDLQFATILLGDGETSAAFPCHIFECEDGATDIGIINGTIKGNLANQTGVYGQNPNRGGTAVWFGSSLTHTCDNVTLDQLRIEEAYGNPISIQYAPRVILNRIVTDKTGEGILIVGCDLAVLTMIESYNTTATGVGDGLEVFNGTGVYINGAILDGWTTGGLDIAGIGISIANVTVSNGYGAMVVQPYSASPTGINPHNFLISNCAAYNCTGIGFLIMGNDASGTSMDGKLLNCVANGCVTGIQIAAFTSSTKLVGYVEVENCTAIRGTRGLIIDSAKYVRITGGNYSLNSDAGITCQFNRAGLADSDVDISFNGVRASNNGTYGLSLATGAIINPTIKGTLYMDGNAGTGITGAQDAQFQAPTAYLLNPNLQIRNLRPAGTPVAGKSQIPCNCDSIMYFSYSELRNLGHATHCQELTVTFTAACAVSDISSGGGRNISLVGGANVTFAANESIKLRYNAPAALWYEEWRQTGY